MIKQVRYRNLDNSLISGRQNLDNGKWNLCARPVFSIFDIPDDAKIVWLTAHERPGANRAEVKLGIEPGGFGFVKIEGKRLLFSYNTRSSIIQLLWKYGTFYVSAEYTT